MVIDAYEKLDRSKGGLPKEDSAITLMTTPGEPEFLSVTSSSAASNPVETGGADGDAGFTSQPDSGHSLDTPDEYEHAAKALDLSSGL